MATSNSRETIRRLRSMRATAGNAAKNSQTQMSATNVKPSSDEVVIGDDTYLEVMDDDV
jgi:hypothetical protein